MRAGMPRSAPATRAATANTIRIGMYSIRFRGGASAAPPPRPASGGRGMVRWEAPAPRPPPGPPPPLRRHHDAAHDPLRATRAPLLPRAPPPLRRHHDAGHDPLLAETPSRWRLA